ncbi:hypothetical protein SDC9_21317 [bioreactor metagenome]|uniref:Uncharacterized protein n=1 Tax=bioreactor metagenome TaxID=1076179 RepID=A0A644U9H4_9ZZZZ
MTLSVDARGRSGQPGRPFSCPPSSARQEGLDRGLDLARALGMQPVPRPLDALELGLRKQRPDRRVILGPDIGRVLAVKEQRRPGEGVGGGGQRLGPGQDAVEAVLQRLEVELPAHRAVAQLERLQQEGARRGILHPLAQPPVGLRARGDVVDPHRLHRVDQIAMRDAVIVVHRRHVGDHDAVHQPGTGQRQHHRRLAAHRVAHHVAGPALPADHPGQILGHRGIGMLVRPEAVAVIAHVERQHEPFFRQPLGDHTPVAGGAEEAGDDEERGQLGVAAMGDDVQHGA